MNTNTKKTKEILIIDDDQTLVSLLRIALEASGYKVWTAFEGKSALDIIKNAHPDLLILDIMMPKVDGFELCRHLKLESHEYAHIPIIMLTARAQQKDKEESILVGADAYVTKPFDTTELINLIGDLINKSTAHAQTHE